MCVKIKKKIWKYLFIGLKLILCLILNEKYIKKMW